MWKVDFPQLLLGIDHAKHRFLALSKRPTAFMELMTRSMN
jgi:hypothetical protein